MSPEPPVAGNVYDKYGTRNPIARLLMQGFERAMCELLSRVGRVGSVLEVGCGEGHLTARLARLFPEARVVGSDLSPEIIALARREHPELEFRVGSASHDVAPGAYDLVVASELLEHVEDPQCVLRAVARAARHHVFVSVPREPLWRVLNVMRGRYLRDLGNTPGHVQHWSRGAFERLLCSELEVVAVRCPLPWTLALCQPTG